MPRESKKTMRGIEKPNLEIAKVEMTDKLEKKDKSKIKRSCIRRARLENTSINLIRHND